MRHLPYDFWQRRTHRSGLVERRDRKSTRLNSSHGYISYAVFCLKKKKIELCFNTNIKLQFQRSQAVKLQCRILYHERMDNVARVIAVLEESTDVYVHYDVPVVSA